MSIYTLKNNRLDPIMPTTFIAESILERTHLQQAFKHNIDAIVPNCLLIAEEFGDWNESNRRIDLLAIDKQANLIVIELKRTETGSHAELQAIRYAAMVSTMTFDDAIEVFTRFKKQNGFLDCTVEDAKLEIEEFVDIDINEVGFGEDVKIVLVSAKFSKELTTSVMWLNERGLDISCIRIVPYNDNDKILIDIQKIIPIPEVEDYQIQVQRKLVEQRETRKTSSKDYTKYQFNGLTLGKGRLALEIIRQYLSQNKSMNSLNKALSTVSHSQPIIEILEIAQHKATETGRARYFLNPDDVLKADDGRQYVVSNQWNKDNIEDIIEVAEEILGFQIDKIKSSQSPVKRTITYHDYEILQLEDSTILVKDKDIKVTAKPILREICQQLDISLENENGSLKNTRSLGSEVLNALEQLKLTK